MCCWYKRTERVTRLWTSSSCWRRRGQGLLTTSCLPRIILQPLLHELYAAICTSHKAVCPLHEKWVNWKKMQIRKIPDVTAGVVSTLWTKQTNGQHAGTSSVCATDWLTSQRVLPSPVDPCQANRVLPKQSTPSHLQTGKLFCHIALVGENIFCSVACLRKYWVRKRLEEINWTTNQQIKKSLKLN